MAASNAVNEGQRLLLLVPDSLATIADEVGCSKPLAGFWRQGKNLPSPDFRAKLERAYRIPRAAWDRKPAGAELDEDDEELDDEDEDEEDNEPTPDYGTLADTLEQIRAIKDELARGGLTDAVRARYRDTLVRQLRLKASIERDHVQAEKLFLKGPRWRAFRERLRTALRAHPAALADVEAAFAETEA